MVLGFIFNELQVWLYLVLGFIFNELLIYASKGSDPSGREGFLVRRII